MDRTGNTSPPGDRDPQWEAPERDPSQEASGQDATEAIQPPPAQVPHAEDQPTAHLSAVPIDASSGNGSGAGDGQVSPNGDGHGSVNLPAPGDFAPELSLVAPHSRPLTPEQLREAIRDARFSRRRRRYTLHLRRNARRRASKRAQMITRAAWISVATAALLILVVLSASFAAASSYYQSEAAQIHNLRQEVVSQDSLRVYDSSGTLLYELRDAGFQHSIDLAHVPIQVVNATIAIEDHDFWNNNGVDYTSIVRAALANYQKGGITQGASSITQQLIKQQLLHDNSDNYDRKLREAILAVGITTSGAYSKSAILELYLNSIGYSPVAYGIDAAAQYYFGYTDDPATGMTAAQRLDLAQASMLAGIPQNPSLNSPRFNYAQAHTRQAQVLNAMVQYGFITQAQANAAWNEAAQPNFFHYQDSNTNLAPHFVNYVLRTLQGMINNGQLSTISRSGLSVYTTLNLQLNNFVQKTIQTHIHSCSQATGYSGYVMCEANVTNGAAVIANQHNGDIVALVGSENYFDSANNGQFDVATLGYRGPGSSMKPIVYATAFEKGWFPAMTIADEPTAFWDAGAGTVYQPLDYTRGQFKGEITLRHALQWSLNIPAVKVMEFAGVDDVKANLARLGVHWNPASTFGLSTVLGTLEVHPIDMVQAYSVFANYGKYIPLHAINSITDSQGNVLYKYQVPANPPVVMDPRVAFLLTNVLSDNAAREADFGGCSDLYLDPFTNQDVWTPECGNLGAHNWTSPNAWPAAAKTGTGNDFKDDWTMGYTMDFTMGVWVGNNNDSDMVHVDGIHGAAPVFKPSMIEAEQLYNKSKTPFPVPTTGVYQASYTSNGVTSTDWFIQGNTLPNESGSKWTPFCFTIPPDSGPWQYCGPGQKGSGGPGGGGGNGNGNGQGNGAATGAIIGNGNIAGNGAGPPGG